MKKVKVLTYCTESSYGSILQAYALKQALLSLNAESEILMKKKAPSEKYRLRFQGPKTPKSLMRFLFQWLARHERAKRYEGTVAFLNEHMDIRYFDSISDLEIDPNAYYLTGSDQVWNPGVLKEEFFLPFVPTGCKKITYAVSMGTLNVPAQAHQRFGDLVRGFPRISVREDSMIEVLQSYTDAKQERHIDPTFLLSSNRWRELEKEYPIHRPYILVFPLYWDASFNKELKALHKKTGKDIIVLSERKNSAYATKRIYDADVRQFLWLLDHADAVVSSSFHGVALSLILEKPLAAVINPAAPSRITSILSCLNYKNLTIGDLADGIAPEYSSVNQKISEETERSIRYLREVLEIEKEH